MGGWPLPSLPTVMFPTTPHYLPLTRPVTWVHIAWLHHLKNMITRRLLAFMLTFSWPTGIRPPVSLQQIFGGCSVNVGVVTAL